MDTSKKLVIIEDDPDSREALGIIVEGLGFSHLSFESGIRALAELPGQTIGVVLLDIMMPRMNGYEFLQKFRQLEEFKGTPVIMVTAKDEDREVFEGYQHGADYYITKPYTTKQIEYGLRLYLDEQSNS